MKNSITFKVWLIYILTAAAGFFCFAVISYNINRYMLISQSSDALYREAMNISALYENAPFSDDPAKRKAALSGINDITAVNEYRTILIKTDGNVIYDSSLPFPEGNASMYRISDFDSTRLGGEHVWIGDFYKVFDEKTMSVFTPVTGEYSTEGYVVLSLAEKDIVRNASFFNLGAFIVYAAMAGLALIFVGFYIRKIKRPIKEITLAVNEYQKGNHDYDMHVDSSREFRELGDSLSKMADDLKRSSKAQQRFLSDISHDFRSPLTSIKGYLTAIQDGTIPPEKLDKYIDILLFETNRLTGLTENILTLNELDPSAVILEKSNFDINNTIKHTIEAMLVECERRGIHFNLSFFADSIYVYADEGKYQQVLYNLVDNAVKFSPDNSVIDISVTHAESGKANVSIRDRGCGIKDDEIGKIWDRLYKTDASRNLDKKSSGLGLSIVKDIINAHGEDISVTSSPQEGTEFVFSVALSQV